MKHILLLFAIGYSLLAVFPPPASAVCGSDPIPVDICIGGVICATREGVRFCCETEDDCRQLRNPPAPPAGASTPTCDITIDGETVTGTPTALGCIPNNPAQAIPLILNWAVGIGTGLGFLLLLYGAFTLITAGPNPENVDKGKSIITSAVSGLLFIILSVVLLKIIGISILGL